MDPAAASLPYMEGPFGHLSEEAFYLTTFPLPVLSIRHGIPFSNMTPLVGFNGTRKTAVIPLKSTVPVPIALSASLVLK